MHLINSHNSTPPTTLRSFALATLAVVSLAMPPLMMGGQAMGQDMGQEMGGDPEAERETPADGEMGTDDGEGPLTDPYADAPLIEAPETAEFNSFADSESAAPVLGLSQMPGAPVVVELFTSQGCNSCPPADAMLAKLAGDPDVLPLSFHVDYWDYLGWKDEFARPEFTRRQQNYARSVGERAVYTPQMIVGGQDTAPAIQPAELMGMIDAHQTSPALVNVSESDAGGRKVVELMPLSDLGGSVAVMLVRFAPERTVKVAGGENNGRLITYRNVVLDISQLASWDGRATLRLTIGADAESGQGFPADTRHAILIQRMTGAKAQLPGPILTSLRLD